MEKLTKLQIGVVTLLVVLIPTFLYLNKSEHSYETYDADEITTDLLYSIETDQEGLYNNSPVYSGKYSVYDNLSPDELENTPDFFDRWRRRPKPEPTPTKPEQPSERQPIFNGPVMNFVRGLVNFFLSMGVTAGVLGTIIVAVFVLGFLNQVMVPIGGPDWVAKYIAGFISMVKGVFKGIIDGIRSSPEPEDLEEDSEEEL